MTDSSQPTHESIAVPLRIAWIAGPTRGRCRP
jgi:hypothetical protein